MKNSPRQHRAIITGASSGIGKATALAFAKAGIDLFLISRNEVKLDDIAKQVGEYGVKVKILSLDLEKVAEVKSKIAILT